LPAGVRRLPVDARGYPVPWFVQWFTPDGKGSEPGVGAPDFRIADGYKRVQAIKHRLCWICGGALGKRVAFVIGPMCVVNRISGDPPMHVACAEFSALACPFLSRPGAERREAKKPDGTTIPGFGIMRNPGVALVWIAERYRPVDDGNGGVLLSLGSPLGLLWYAEGRRATRAEILASIESGLPILRGAAHEEGPEAEAALEQQVTRALELVPVQ
jgi:hypothetical protein